MRGESPDMEPSLDCWFSIFLLYIWSPHLVTKQSGVPSGILGVLIPSYPLKKDDFRNHFIIIQKNTTQWTQPTVAGSIIFQPTRNHEIWNKKHTAKSKGKPLKIVSNKLQMFLYIPPNQIGYSMFFQGKFHPSKTKKNRAFVEDSHVHIIPTLWQHGIMIWSQLHWKSLGFLKAASEWWKDVHFVGQKTSNFSFETPFPWESHLFFFGISLHNHRVSKSKFWQKSANKWNNWTTGSLCTKLLELLLTSVCDSCVYHA